MYDHYFQADCGRKIVTHKPSNLEICCLVNGVKRCFTLAIKTSEDKIKRRLNRCFPITNVFITCDTDPFVMAQQQKMQTLLQQQQQQQQLSAVNGDASAPPPPTLNNAPSLIQTNYIGSKYIYSSYPQGVQHVLKLTKTSTKNLPFNHPIKGEPVHHGSSGSSAINNNSAHHDGYNGITTEPSSTHPATSLPASASSSSQETEGFLYHVETKGGKTSGRQKQNYILLKRDAIYTLSCPLDVLITSIELKSATHETIQLKHWMSGSPTTTGSSMGAQASAATFNHTSNNNNNMMPPQNNNMLPPQQPNNNWQNSMNTWNKSSAPTTTTTTTTAVSASPFMSSPPALSEAQIQLLQTLFPNLNPYALLSATSSTNTMHNSEHQPINSAAHNHASSHQPSNHNTFSHYNAHSPHQSHQYYQPPSHSSPSPFSSASPMASSAAFIKSEPHDMLSHSSSRTPHSSLHHHRTASSESGFSAAPPLRFVSPDHAQFAIKNEHAITSPMNIHDLIATPLQSSSASAISSSTAALTSPSYSHNSEMSYDALFQDLFPPNHLTSSQIDTVDGFFNAPLSVTAASSSTQAHSQSSLLLSPSLAAAFTSPASPVPLMFPQQSANDRERERERGHKHRSKKKNKRKKERKIYRLTPSVWNMTQKKSPFRSTLTSRVRWTHSNLCVQLGNDFLPASALDIYKKHVIIEIPTPVTPLLESQTLQKAIKLYINNEHVWSGVFTYKNSASISDSSDSDSASDSSSSDDDDGNGDGLSDDFSQSDASSSRGGSSSSGSRHSRDHSGDDDNHTQSKRHKTNPHSDFSNQFHAYVATLPSSQIFVAHPLLQLGLFNIVSHYVQSLSPSTTRASSISPLPSASSCSSDRRQSITPPLPLTPGECTTTSSDDERVHKCRTPVRAKHRKPPSVHSSPSHPKKSSWLQACSSFDEAPLTFMHNALMHSAQQHIQSGSLNTIDSFGFSLLHYAVSLNDCELVAYLIQLGADVNIQAFNNNISPHQLALEIPHSNNKSTPLSTHHSTPHQSPRIAASLFNPPSKKKRRTSHSQGDDSDESMSDHSASNSDTNHVESNKQPVAFKPRRQPGKRSSFTFQLNHFDEVFVNSAPNIPIHPNSKLNFNSHHTINTPTSSSFSKPDVEFSHTQSTHKILQLLQQHGARIDTPCVTFSNEQEEKLRSLLMKKLHAVRQSLKNTHSQSLLSPHSSPISSSLSASPVPFSPLVAHHNEIMEHEQRRVQQEAVRYELALIITYAQKQMKSIQAYLPNDTINSTQPPSTKSLNHFHLSSALQSLHLQTLRSLMKQFLVLARYFVSLQQQTLKDDDVADLINSIQSIHLHAANLIDSNESLNLHSTTSNNEVHVSEADADEYVMTLFHQVSLIEAQLRSYILHMQSTLNPHIQRAISQSCNVNSHVLSASVSSHSASTSSNSDDVCVPSTSPALSSSRPSSLYVPIETSHAPITIDEVHPAPSTNMSDDSHPTASIGSTTLTQESSNSATTAHTTTSKVIKPSIRDANKFSLLIGINEYSSHLQVPSLKGCVNDVKKFHSLLVSKYGFEPVTDTLTVPSPSAVAGHNPFSLSRSQLLLNERADRVRIRQYLTHLVSSLTSSSDILVIYFAGHGFHDSMLMHDGPLHYSEFIHLLAHIPTRHVTFISDTCTTHTVPSTSNGAQHGTMSLEQMKRLVALADAARPAAVSSSSISSSTSVSDNESCRSVHSECDTDTDACEADVEDMESAMDDTCDSAMDSLTEQNSDSSSDDDDEDDDDDDEAAMHEPTVRYRGLAACQSDEEFILDPSNQTPASSLKSTDFCLPVIRRLFGNVGYFASFQPNTMAAELEFDGNWHGSLTHYLCQRLAAHPDIQSNNKSEPLNPSPIALNVSLFGEKQGDLSNPTSASHSRNGSRKQSFSSLAELYDMDIQPDASNSAVATVTTSDAASSSSSSSSTPSSLLSVDHHEVDEIDPVFHFDASLDSNVEGEHDRLRESALGVDQPIPDDQHQRSTHIQLNNNNSVSFYDFIKQLFTTLITLLVWNPCAFIVKSLNLSSVSSNVNSSAIVATTSSSTQETSVESSLSSCSSDIVPSSPSSTSSSMSLSSPLSASSSFDLLSSTESELDGSSSDVAAHYSCSHYLKDSETETEQLQDSPPSHKEKDAALKTMTVNISPIVLSPQSAVEADVVVEASKQAVTCKSDHATVATNSSNRYALKFFAFMLLTTMIAMLPTIYTWMFSSSTLLSYHADADVCTTTSASLFASSTCSLNEAQA